MNEIWIIILTIIAGFLLGVFFFGGLWWTTKKGLLSKSPTLWFLLSLFIRVGITLTAFYFISRDHWEKMVFCLLGFIVARFIIMRFTQVPEIKQNQ